MTRTVRKPVVIAIDGPAGVGKSTLARKLAAALGFRYIDTGAMYRAVAWWLLQQGIDLSDEQAVSCRLTQLELEIISGEDQAMGIKIEGQEVSPWLRTEEVAQAASTLAIIPGARTHLVDLYRKEGAVSNVVMEGRDIGTVAFPDACLKLFITASEEIRCRRRFQEHLQTVSKIHSKDIEESLHRRDLRDQQRKHAPLRPAGDAVLIDTTNMTIEEVFKKALDLTREKLCL